METSPAAAARALRWAIEDAGTRLPPDAVVAARGAGPGGEACEGWAAASYRMEVTLRATREHAEALAGLLAGLGLHGAGASMAHATGSVMRVTATAGEAELAALPGSAARLDLDLAADCPPPYRARRRACAVCGRLIAAGGPAWCAVCAREARRAEVG